MWVGSYPPGGAGTPGRGEGVRLLDLAGLRPGPARQPDGADSRAQVPSASFLAQHPRGDRLYVVSEVGPGLLTVFRPGRSPWSLDPVAVTASGGAFPCHVTLDRGGRSLFVAHYGDGVVAAFELDSAGDVAGPPVLLPADRGPRPGPRHHRQDGPHAHACLVSPDGRFLLVADLGTDEVRRYRCGGGRPPETDGVTSRFPPGSGPRHLALRSDDAAASTPRGTLYVALELSAELAVLDWAPGDGSAELRRLEPLSLPAPGRGTANGAVPVQPSHLVVDGDRLIVGVRGRDVLATYRILDDGGVTLVGVTPTVAWPRHFGVVGEWLVVAGERAHAVGLHPRRDAAGAVGELRREVPVPAPACVVGAAGWRG